MKYRPLLLSPLGLISAGLQPVDAADMKMPAKAPPQAIPYTPSWAGFYGGVNLGLIGDRSEQEAFFPAPATFSASSYCWANASGVSFFDCTFTNSQTAYGVLGGVQIGYNFQSGNWVVGAEADIDYSSARKTTLTTFTGGGGAPLTATEKTGVEALGTARLRLGYAFDRALPYVTGGLAYAKMVNTFQGVSGYTWSDTGWRTGWTVGGGIEYQFTDRMSVKAEGLYYDLGHEDHVSFSSAVVGFGTVGLRDHMTGFVARLGLNYRFR
jgi:outer membrane immunogenic protein